MHGRIDECEGRATETPRRIATPDGIRFLLDGKVVTVDGVAPTRSVLNFLREDLGRTGTKEGCAEGDCGACTVVVGELAGDRGRAARRSTRASSSCPTLDGKALFTVEDLRQPNGDLHPVQQAMVDCHGSQCGFCTPGLRDVAVGALLEHDGRAARGPTAPRAAQRAHRQPVPLHRLPADPRCRRAHVRPAARCRSIAPRCARSCASIARTRIACATSTTGSRVLRAAHAGRARRPARRASAGAHPRRHHRHRPVGDEAAARPAATSSTSATSTSSRRSRERDGMLRIGAGASLDRRLSRARRGTTPSSREMWERFASPPIRNAGTMGGNVANGSPIGDSMPVLIALGATRDAAQPRARRARCRSKTSTSAT